MAKLTNHNASENAPYSDGVDPDSAKLPEDNDLVIPDGADSFENHITDQ